VNQLGCSAFDENIQLKASIEISGTRRTFPMQLRGETMQQSHIKRLNEKTPSPYEFHKFTKIQFVNMFFI
jgi:hypothetical protein